MAAKRDFEYSRYDLEMRIGKYFDDCAKRNRKPTMPGLCNWLNLSRNRMIKLLSYAELYTETTANRRANIADEDIEPDIQFEHCVELLKASQRMQDELEQNTDTISLFKLKQGWYGGYTDKAAASENPNVNVKISLSGMGNKDPFK